MKIYLILLALLALASAKVCWKNCSEDAKLLRSFNVDGCRRRRGQPGRGPPKFRCNENIGPPCTVKRGDTVYLDVDFAPDFALKELKQEAFWLTNFGFQLPWAGMDTDGCKYLQHNCTAEAIQDQVQKFSYPISIKKMYPVGKYNLKWSFNEMKNGTKTEVGCVYYTIRIL